VSGGYWAFAPHLDLPDELQTRWVEGASARKPSGFFFLLKGRGQFFRDASAVQARAYGRRIKTMGAMLGRRGEPGCQTEINGEELLSTLLI